MRTAEDASYRRDRIDSLTARDVSSTDAARVMDTWHIHLAHTTDGHGYVPAPLWDDEWLLTRTAHPTAAAAESAVHAVGGRLCLDHCA